MDQATSTITDSSFLFDASMIFGPAISHPGQVPEGWDALIIAGIGFAELRHAETYWLGLTPEADVKFDQRQVQNSDYYIPWLYWI